MQRKHYTAEAIRGLIAKDELYRFYNSAEWRSLKKLKLKAEHNECERCRVKGKYKKAIVAHHIKRVRSRPDLALNFKNLEALCNECHYEEHHKHEAKIPERW